MRSQWTVTAFALRTNCSNSWTSLPRRIGCYSRTSGSCFRRTGCRRSNEFAAPNTDQDCSHTSSTSAGTTLGRPTNPMAMSSGGCRATSWTRARSRAGSCQPSRSLFAALPAVVILPPSRCRSHQMSPRCRHRWLAGRRWAVRAARCSANRTETLLQSSVVGPPFGGSKPRPRPNAG